MTDDRNDGPDPARRPVARPRRDAAARLPIGHPPRLRAALAHVEEIKSKIAAAGSESYINMNAADEKRAGALAALGAGSMRRGRPPPLRPRRHALPGVGRWCPRRRPGAPSPKMEMTRT
jgi:hypothetical protein